MSRVKLKTTLDFLALLMSATEDADDKKTKEEKWHMFVLNITYACLCGVLLLLMIYIGYRVYKIVKLNDKVMLTMIFFLNLELLSKIFFYSMNAQEDIRDVPFD